MDEFLGKDYILVSGEHFDEYLAFTGVGYLARKAASTLKPTVCLIRNDDGTYSFIIKSKLFNSTLKFTLGEEFEETRPDGAKVKSIITFEENKMIHIQTDVNGRTATIIREYFPDKLIVTTTAEGFDKIATRQFQLVK